MNSDLFKLSENAQLEYCACIVKIGQLEPIENSDFLSKTYVNGFPIVVRKEEVKEGDIMIYCPIETVLNRKFLSENNLFDLSERKMNSNYRRVQQLIDEGKKDEAKRLVGFFNKHGRIKIVNLRGVPSMGFLFSPDDLLKWKKKIDLSGIEELVGTQFDTINDELFIKVYVPYVPAVNEQTGNKHFKRRQKAIKRFDRMIDGEFTFHYDTNQLGVNMHKINPDDKVFIDVKFHGTSFICGNVKVKQPIRISLAAKLIRKRLFYDLKHSKNAKQAERIKKLIPKNYIPKYGNVYSSRSIIKNQYINAGVTDGFYGSDIWGEVNKILFPYIPKGMIVYGEIIGYIPSSRKMIQKGYDYGCNEDQFKFLIYRIVTKDENGYKKEWNKSEVDKWTRNLVKEHPELKNYVQFLEVLYHGKLKDLYPQISTSEHWHEEVLKAIENDKEHFGLELTEPLCINQVPREGIVIRIDNDKAQEAFKLKAIAFYMREKNMIDNGEIDAEMAENKNYQSQ